ncbi:MAG: hypothetical protein ACFBSD_00430 [Paracoccaceae bacterium]
MTADDPLLVLVARGHSILAEERQTVASGRFADVSKIESRKTALLDALEDAIRKSPATVDHRAALEGLIADSRRNERILRAAQEGLRRARTRIAAILATRKGDVAYAEDGSRITSRADAEGRSKSA